MIARGIHIEGSAKSYLMDGGFDLETKNGETQSRADDDDADEESVSVLQGVRFRLHESRPHTF